MDKRRERGEHIARESMSSSEGQVAPFVAKTYQMVSDPRTDGLIRWGRANNSFLVLDPAAFSHLLLPYYFKHGNFSSFVRQLNTYGFRKVDPDRWEFAHESFLRGQTHLLPLMVRRKKREDGGAEKKDGVEEEMLLQELGRLRKEQTALEEELQGMNRRLQATEKGPRQMMSFLAKVAEDPDLLPQLINSKRAEQQGLVAGDKKRRLISSSSSSLHPVPSMTVASEAEPSFEPITFALDAPFPAVTDDCAAGMSSIPFLGIDSGDAAAFHFQPEQQVPEASTVAYPFSLLGNGFI